MTLREAAQQALEAIESDTVKFSAWTEKMLAAQTALRAALEYDETEMLLRQHRFEIGRLRAALAEPTQEELRRLHALNAELVEALHWIADRCPAILLEHPLHRGLHMEAAYDAGVRARAALAKVEASNGS